MGDSLSRAASEAFLADLVERELEVFSSILGQLCGPMGQVCGVGPLTALYFADANRALVVVREDLARIPELWRE